MNNITFRIVARSSNTNSFGLRGHVLVSRTGKAYEVARSDYSGNAAWLPDTDVTVPAHEGEPQWARACCELPRRMARPSCAMMRALFGSAWRPSKAYNAIA